MDEPQEVQIDVSRDNFRRAIHDPTTPTYIPGYRVVAHIPFTGDKMVFKLQPGRHGMNPPRADVADGELRLVIEYPHDAPIDINSETQGLIRDVEDYLRNARKDIESFNADLEAKARQAIHARRERVEQHEQHVQTTGLPVGPPDAADGHSRPA